MRYSRFKHVRLTTKAVAVLALVSGATQSSYGAGFDNRYDLEGTVLPSGMSIVDLTIDGRQPRYPETFIDDIDGDGLPEFVAFPGNVEIGQCKPLLIALSSVRGSDDIDSSDSRYITIPDANGTVRSDSFCTEIETFETIGDMDGDGFAEFALYSQGTYVIQKLKNASGEIRLSDLNGLNGFLIKNALLRRNVGDLNIDGLDELSVSQFGSQSFDIENEYIVSGRAGARSAVIFPEEDTAGELLATIYNGRNNFSLVAPLGDVNDDGIEDLLIRQSDSLNVVYGSVALQIPTDLLSDPEAPVLGENCGVYSCPVLTDFDFDADGYGDIAITFGRGPDDRSAIIYGGPDGLPTGMGLEAIPANRVTLLTGKPRLSSGFTDVFGDVNSDGYDDIYFSSGNDTVILLATPGRRIAEIDIDSLDGSNGFRLAASQTQVSGTFRPFINGRVLMADFNGDGIDDYADGRLVVNGIDGATDGSAPLGILVRQGPESADLFWSVLDDVQNVESFRVTVGDQLVAELPAASRSTRVEGNFREQSLDVTISSIGFDKQVLGATTRRIQIFGDGFGLRGEVYGPNILELFWDAPAADYLLWRDGEVYQRVNGQSFLDRDVEPGVVHEYFITDDVLTGGNATAEYYNSLEGLQKRTNAILIGPASSAEPIDPEVPPSTPGGQEQRPNVPSNISGIVYSATAAEVFWAPVTNTSVSRYDVYRNAQWVASVPGPSWFDDTLEPFQTYRYSIVAVSAGGVGSAASPTLTLNTSVNTSVSIDRPVSPAGLRALVYSSNAAELFWDRNTDQAVDYIITSQGTEVGRSNGTSYFVTGLSADETYEFTVSPIDQNLAAQTEPATTTITTFP